MDYESRNMVVTIWRVLQRKDENPIGKVSGGNCTSTLNEVSSWPTSRTIAQGVTKRNARPGCRGKLDVSTRIRAKILTLAFTSAPQVCNNDRPYISMQRVTLTSDLPNGSSPAKAVADRSFHCGDSFHNAISLS